MIALSLVAAVFSIGMVIINHRNKEELKKDWQRELRARYPHGLPVVALAVLAGRDSIPMDQRPHSGYGQTPSPGYGQTDPSHRYGQTDPSFSRRQTLSLNYGQTSFHEYGQTSPHEYGQTSPTAYEHLEPSPATEHPSPAGMGHPIML
jgi:hypothetical protein